MPNQRAVVTFDTSHQLDLIPGGEVLPAETKPPESAGDLWG